MIDHLPWRECSDPLGRTEAASTRGGCDGPAAASPLRALDLFCGAAGGWSLGLHRAGMQTVAACEIDEWRRKVFQHNNPGVRMYDDIRDLTAARLVRDLGYLPDIIVGSPPCQDISGANAKGCGVEGERSGLFFEAVRLAEEIRPRWLVLENSPNLRIRGGDRVLSGLEALNYACWPLVVGAGNAGAPHRRQRAWLVAADADRAGLEEWVCSTGWEASLDPAQQLHGVVGSFARATPDACRGDDGLPELLADRRGLRKRCIAAYGDAVLPQITEAIARAILTLDAHLFPAPCREAPASAGEHGRSPRERRTPLGVSSLTRPLRSGGGASFREEST